jgi:hypothetical protein
MTSLLSFITGLTLLLISAFLCYGTFFAPHKLDAIVVTLIVYIPIGLFGTRLIRNALEENERSLAVYVISGSIWVGFLLLAAAAFFFYQVSTLPPSSPKFADEIPVNTVLYFGLGFTLIPLLILFGGVVIEAINDGRILLLVMITCIFIGVFGVFAVGVGIYSMYFSEETSSTATVVNQSQNTIIPTEKPVTLAKARTSIISANVKYWRLIGSGTFTLKIEGSINYGGSDRTVTTESRINLGDKDALAPGIPFGVMVGKIGEKGEPFQLFSTYKYDGNENLYIALNDSYYGDNTGQYIVKVEPVVTQLQKRSSQPRTSPVSCVQNPASSCWTINPKNLTLCPPLNTRPASVEFLNDEVWIYVPANMKQGIKAISNERSFTLQKGDKFEIRAEGQVRFSNDHPCTTPEGVSGWYDPVVDSPFNQNVGGLEFSIGSLQNNRYFAGTYYIGTAQESGVPTFRVIERLTGYEDNNSGGFAVVLRKIE